MISSVHQRKLHPMQSFTEIIIMKTTSQKGKIEDCFPISLLLSDLALWHMVFHENNPNKYDFFQNLM